LTQTSFTNTPVSEHDEPRMTSVREALTDTKRSQVKRKHHKPLTQTAQAAHEPLASKLAVLLTAAQVTPSRCRTGQGCRSRGGSRSLTRPKGFRKRSRPCPGLPGISFRDVTPASVLNTPSCFTRPRENPAAGAPGVHEALRKTSPRSKHMASRRQSNSHLSYLGKRVKARTEEPRGLGEDPKIDLNHKLTF
jgi:hypothetical protein